MERILAPLALMSALPGLWTLAFEPVKKITRATLFPLFGGNVLSVLLAASRSPDTSNDSDNILRASKRKRLDQSTHSTPGSPSRTSPMTRVRMRSSSNWLQMLSAKYGLTIITKPMPMLNT
jgi:hypothetical protein